MGCFSLGWLEQFLVWCVIVGAIIAIIRLLVPYVLSMLGIPVVGQVLNIVLWAIVAIFVIYICFDLIGCLVASAGGLSLPHHH